MLVALVGSLVLARRDGVWNLASSLSLYAVALLLKERAVVWPLIIFLVLYDGFDRTLRRTLPFWGMTILYLMLRIVVLGKVIISASSHPVLDWGLCSFRQFLARYFYCILSGQWD